ncbi:hypothetical protein [Campylobacter jejuni]|uniref:hypothetical protein n=1 Tax=Campylobacter jejuni TaxID=197 RepID=UPI003C6C752F
MILEKVFIRDKRLRKLRKWEEGWKKKEGEKWQMSKGVFIKVYKQKKYYEMFLIVEDRDKNLIVDIVVELGKEAIEEKDNCV